MSELRFEEALIRTTEYFADLGVEISSSERDYNIRIIPAGQSKFTCGLVVRKADYKLYANTTRAWYDFTEGINEGLTNGKEPWFKIEFESLNDCLAELRRFLTRDLTERTATKPVKDMLADLEEYYETAGFADFDQRVLSRMNEEQIREYYKETFAGQSPEKL